MLASTGDPVFIVYRPSRQTPRFGAMLSIYKNYNILYYKKLGKYTVIVVKYPGRLSAATFSYMEQSYKGRHLNRDS